MMAAFRKFTGTLEAVLLVALFAVASASGASAQVVQLTFVNHVAQPLKVSNSSPPPESAASVTATPGGTGALSLNNADRSAVILFNVGPDTYVLVSDNDLARVFGRAHGEVTMIVSGPPCANGQGGLQTLTAILDDSVSKCANMDQ